MKYSIEFRTVDELKQKVDLLAAFNGILKNSMEEHMSKFSIGYTILDGGVMLVDVNELENTGLTISNLTSQAITDLRNQINEQLKIKIIE